jgi:hypothetical protein
MKHLASLYRRWRMITKLNRNLRLRKLCREQCWARPYPKGRAGRG